VVKEQYRQQKRTRHDELHESLPSGSQSVEKQVSQRLLRQRLHKVMERLTEDQRDVLALRFGFDMPIREVAETLGKSEGSVKMLQARALTTLSHFLSEAGES
jgi:RNA polymerase sigma-70 factor (ECF subfamily)